MTHEVSEPPIPAETAIAILEARLDLVKSGEKGRWVMLLEQRDEDHAYIYQEDVDSEIVGKNAGKNVVLELMRKNGADPKQFEESPGRDGQVYSGPYSSGDRLVFDQRGSFRSPTLKREGSGLLQPATEYWVSRV